MNCPNCSQAVETGAAFCGNCGQSLQQTLTSGQTYNGPFVAAAAAGGLAVGVPNYALAAPNQHRGETKALLSLLFGIIGIVGALFIPVVGLILGITGVVMGTMSRSGVRRGLSTTGLIVSSLAVLAGLATWAYNIKHDPALNQNGSPAANQNEASVVAADLSTPCYSLGFAEKLNISNSSNNCDMKAFNGTAFGTSTDVYKIYASQSQITDAGTFNTYAKQALEKDVKTSLPGFSISKERVGAFAGSPAYIINVSDNKNGIALVEAAVFHKVSSGENIFILVHGVNDKTADLTNLEAQWQWK